MLGVDMADWGYAEEKKNNSRGVILFLILLIMVIVIFGIFMNTEDEVMPAEDTAVIVANTPMPSPTIIEETVMPTPTLSDADLIRNKLERDVPLATITDVVVTDYSEPPIIQVTMDVFSGDQRDHTLAQMDEIVCSLKDAQWNGYRYRLAARLPSGPAGIIMAIEPDVVEQLNCEFGMTINWENATSEYFIIDSLR